MNNRIETILTHTALVVGALALGLLCVPNTFGQEPTAPATASSVNTCAQHYLAVAPGKGE